MNCGQKLHQPGISCSVICGQKIHSKIHDVPKISQLGVKWDDWMIFVTILVENSNLHQSLCKINETRWLYLERFWSDLQIHFVDRTWDHSIEQMIVYPVTNHKLPSKNCPTITMNITSSSDEVITFGAFT